MEKKNFKEYLENMAIYYAQIFFHLLICHHVVVSLISSLFTRAKNGYGIIISMDTYTHFKTFWKRGYITIVRFR